MGVLGAAQLSVEELERDLVRLGEELGDIPFGVDLLSPGATRRPTRAGCRARSWSRQVPDEHRAFVAGLMDDFGVPELEEGYEFGDIVDGEASR